MDTDWNLTTQPTSPFTGNLRVTPVNIESIQKESPMDPDKVAEQVSRLVSREGKDASVEEYQEALGASIGMLQSDLDASRDS